MDQNIGMADRIIRVILGVIFVILALVHSYWWFIPAVIALATGMVGWCGLYQAFNWNTNTMEKPVKTKRAVKPLKKVVKKRKK